MEAPIFSEEMEETIRTIKVNKAPGLDGYTLEFYKKFSKQLAPLSTKVVLYLFGS